jgi:DNA-binding MarR family transcriptional regulator
MGNTRTVEEELQQQQFRNDSERAFVNLIYTASWFQNRFQSFLKPFGLTPQQYNILRILKGQKDRAISLNAVKNRMLEPNSDTSRIIDRMVRKGLIERKACTQDRRQVDLTLTDTGTDLLQRVGYDIDPVIGSIHCLDRAEQQTLSEILDKLRYAPCAEDIVAAKAR